MKVQHKMAPQLNKRHAFALVTFVTLFVAVLGIYYQVHAHEFVWDTIPFVIENPLVHDPGLREVLAMFVTVHEANWHPVVLLSHALDFALFDMYAGGHHVVNAIFHWFNSCLVYVFVAAILAVVNEMTVRRAQMVAFLTALLFAIHPQHVESVAWVVERKDVLYTFFGLLALIFYLYRHTSNGPGLLVKFSPLLFFLLALMSKPMAVTFPFVMLLIDFYPLKRDDGVIRSLPRLIAEKWVYWLFALAVGVITLNTQGIAMPDVDQLPLWVRVLTAINNFWFYAESFIVPLGLSPLYPYPSTLEAVSTPSYWFPGAVFLTTLTGLTIWLWRRDIRWPLLLWLFYLVTLLPVSGLIHVGPAKATDHYTYLATASIGLAIALGIVYAISLRWLRPVAVAIAIWYPVFLGMIAHQQTAIWRNPLTLWTYTVRVYPESALAHRNLASALVEIGELETALVHAELSLKYGGPARDYVRQLREVLSGEMEDVP